MIYITMNPIIINLYYNSNSGTLWIYNNAPEIQGNILYEL